MGCNQSAAQGTPVINPVNIGQHYSNSDQNKQNLNKDEPKPDCGKPTQSNTTIVNIKPQETVLTNPPNKIEEPKKVQKLDQATLSNIQKFQFTKSSQKMLEGKSSTEKTGGNNVPNISQADCFDNFGVASLWYQNYCYTDGTYNNNGYKVQKGNVAGKQAYKINPPAQKFKQFLASEHCICFKLNEVKDYTIYKFVDGSLDTSAQIQKKNVKANSWYLVTTVKISTISKPIVYILLPSDQKLTPFQSLGKDIQGGTIFKDNKIRIQLIRFPLPNNPPVPENFPFGPGNHSNCYNPNRDLFYISAKGKQYIVWGTEDKNNAYITQINRKQIKVNSVAIKGKIAGYELAGACGNDSAIYYSQVESGDAAGTSKMQLIKLDYNGSETKKQVLNTDKNNLNIFHFDACHLVLNGNQIGMIVSRKMTKHTDGLNHQSAYAAIFDANTLKLVKAIGQTSSHSFSQNLVPKIGGGFLGMDLADNYPRGINFWRINETSITTKLVYSFKTQHGTKATSPAGKSYPEYSQISTGNKKFYKWSNDNKTYTELAAPGIFQHQTGNIILFAGQNQPRALDNSKTGGYNNSSRNIGFVKASKDISGPILSEGVEETGGFFTFNGQWQQLKNKGIKWLTKLSDGNNASRVKAVGFGDLVFIIFELWTKDTYVNTQYMLVDINGKVVTPNTVIPYQIRLQKSDDIYANDNTIVIYAGGKGKILNRYEIFIQK